MIYVDKKNHQKCDSSKIIKSLIFNTGSALEFEQVFEHGPGRGVEGRLGPDQGHPDAHQSGLDHPGPEHPQGSLQPHGFQNQ